MVANFFLNREQGRLHALWRLILQGLLFVVTSGLGNILFGVLIGLLMIIMKANIQDSQQMVASGSLTWVRAAGSMITLLATLLSCWIAGRWLDHRPFKSFGFNFSKRWWLDFAFGLFLGAVLMVFIFIVELSAGWITITGTVQSLSQRPNFWTAILAALVTFICVGIYEELLSRG